MDRIAEVEISDIQWKERYMLEKKKNFTLTEHIQKLEHELKVFKSIRSFEDWIKYCKRES